MTMHQERLAAAVLDMYWGGREEWFDNALPYGMNVDLANPAYRDHVQRLHDGSADASQINAHYRASQ